MSDQKSDGERKSSLYDQSVVVGVCQLEVGADKAKNVASMISVASKLHTKDKCDVLVLPECWNSPYSNDSFPEYAEVVPGMGEEVSAQSHPSTHALSSLAKACGAYVIGGSIPERVVDDDGKTTALYNTCTVWNGQGEMVGKHRKMHLFDICVPGGITFKESDTLSAGDDITTFKTPFGTCAVGICYDMRFPTWIEAATREEDCTFLFLPAAFNTTTGPKHWHLLQRARAVDYQVFVVSASPARIPGASYQAYGHSLCVNPWGEIELEFGHESQSGSVECVLAKLDEVRTAIPVRQQRRKDVCDVQTNEKSK